MTNRRFAALPLLLALAFSTSSCVFFRQASEPMPGVLHPSVSGKAEGLVVFMPGFADGPEDFENNGFVEMVRQAHPDFDVLAPDAHFGYYRSFTVIDRLHADLIEPIRHRYEKIWLVGISMGGFGAVAYSLEHGDHVDGIILLAPYMGPTDVIEEVQAAGGLAAWQPPADWREIEDPETRKYYEVWDWFRGYAVANAERPAMYLGYGASDHLAVPNGLVASVLPEAQREVQPGEHKWFTWRPIFGALLRRARTQW